MRRGPGRPPGRKTIAGSLAALMRSNAAELAPVDDGVTWPSVKYQRNPVGFVRDVLGVEPTARQIEILESVRDHKRTAVTTGRKMGKSAAAAMVALWFFSSFPRAKVRLAAPKISQVTDIVWDEVRRFHANAKIPLSGMPSMHAGSGLMAEDGRSIKAFAAIQKEKGQGISGPQCVIVDEASGFRDDSFFETLEGNAAGGHFKLLLTSNPTRNEGELYRAFHDKADFYNTIQISSRESPNVIAGREVIAGLATLEWVEDMIKMHGEKSPWFQIHVEGKFVEGQEGKVNSLHDIMVGQKAWYEAEASGPLVASLDPAGHGPGGDASVFSFRRGFKFGGFHEHYGKTVQQLLSHWLAYLKEYAPNERELVPLVLDREGPIGAEVYGTFVAASRQPRARFVVIPVRASDRAQREPMIYETVRDELWAAGAAFLQDGAAIPEHVKLTQDLNAPSWEGTVRGRTRVTSKDELRKMLGRSTDHGDAYNLSAWYREGMHIPAEQRPRNERESRQNVGSVYDAGRGLDPYGGR